MSSLALVIALIVTLAWLFQRISRGRGGLVGQFGVGGRSPSGVMEVLGRYPVARGMSVVLLRVDRRVLVLSHAHAGLRGRGGSLSTLSEVIDEEGVASLIRKTQDEEGESLSARFKGLLSGFGAEAGEEDRIEDWGYDAGGRVVQSGADGDVAAFWDGATDQHVDDDPYAMPHETHGEESDPYDAGESLRMRLDAYRVGGHG